MCAQQQQLCMHTQGLRQLCVLQGHKRRCLGATLSANGFSSHFDSGARCLMHAVFCLCLFCYVCLSV